MRRRESLKPSRREKSSFQATSSSLRSLVVPRPSASAPFPEEASAAIPSAMKLVPSKGGMLVPSEIDFTHSRTQTTLTQFALVVLPSAPPSNSGQGGRGISLPLTGKGPAASARPSVPCPSLPWALARPLSLSPSGTGGNIEAAPSLRSQSTGVGAANNGFGRRQHQAVAFAYCRAAMLRIGRLGIRSPVESLSGGSTLTHSPCRHPFSPLLL